MAGGRQSNFELMRIVAMILIVGCHFVCNIFPVEKHIFISDVSKALWFPGGQVGVALFFILSGFFYQTGVIKPNKVLKIVLELFFYAWLIAIVYFASKYLGFYDFPMMSHFEKTETLASVLIPFSSGTWWFITAYIPLQLAKKYLNNILDKFNRKGLLLLLLSLWFFWYSISNGYKGVLSFFTFEKAFFFYSLGFYIKKFLHGKYSFLYEKLSLLLGIFFYLSASFLQVLYESDIAFPFPKILLYALQGSVCVPAAAFFIFIFFSNMNIGSRKVINYIAATTLGIYIFHRGNPIGHIFYRKIFNGCIMYESMYFPLTLFLSIISIFLICALIEILRMRFIEPFMLNKVSLLYGKLRKHIFSDE